MLQKIFLTTILTIISFTLVAQAQKQADTSIFGVMKIGEKFTPPECPQASYGGYKITIDAPCWKNISASYDYSLKKKKDEAAASAPAVAMTGTVYVAFPFAEQPALSSSSQIVAQIVDGALEGIGFNTSGIVNQDYVLEKLTGKYGAATESKSVKVQNRLGAEFNTLAAVWQFDNLIVVFHSAETSLDSGLVNIDSPKGKKRREDAINEILKKNRSL